MSKLAFGQTRTHTHLLVLVQLLRWSLIGSAGRRRTAKTAALVAGTVPEVRARRLARCALRCCRMPVPRSGDLTLAALCANAADELLRRVAATTAYLAPPAVMFGVRCWTCCWFLMPWRSTVTWYSSWRFIMMKPFGSTSSLPDGLPRRSPSRWRTGVACALCRCCISPFGDIYNMDIRATATLCAGGAWWRRWRPHNATYVTGLPSVRCSVYKQQLSPYIRWLYAAGGWRSAADASYHAAAFACAACNV